MPPQMQIRMTQPRWRGEGQVASYGLQEIKGALSSAYNGEIEKTIPFGRAAYLDPTTKMVTRPTAAPVPGTIVIVPTPTARYGFEGYNLRSMSSAYDYKPLPAGATAAQRTAFQKAKATAETNALTRQDQAAGYPVGGDVMIEYYRVAVVVMWSESAATMGGKVYFRNADAAPPKDTTMPLFAGRVAGAASDNHTELLNAYFADSIELPGLVPVQLTDLMIVR